MKTKRKYLSIIIALGIGSSCLATAEARIWTDNSGKHTVDAEFVALEAGQITLKTAAGRMTTFPLANLTPADRAFAEKADEKSGAPDVDSEVKCIAKASLTEIISESENGVQTSSHNLELKVELIGGDAANAYAIDRPTVKPLVIGGKTITPEEGYDGDGFRIVDRSGRDFFAQHPKNGVRIALIYEAAPEGATTIENVEGTVNVLAGGVANSIDLDRPLTHPKGSIDDPSLRACGLDLRFARQAFDDQITLEILMKEGTTAFAGLELISESGEQLENVGTGTMSDGRNVGHSVTASKKALKDAKLRIHFRQGAKEVELPFSATAITVEKQ